MVRNIGCESRLTDVNDRACAWTSRASGQQRTVSPRLWAAESDETVQPRQRDTYE